MIVLTQDELKSILSYDPETGVFTWVKGNRVGKRAGTPHSAGYWQVAIKTKFYLAHRLAWLYVYGEFPATNLDHINGIRSDTRIENLRKCLQTENLWNCGIGKANTSGFKGVSWHKPAGKWHAQIMVGRVTESLGLFQTAELASAAYNTKAKELHGNFYRDTTINKTKRD